MAEGLADAEPSVFEITGEVGAHGAAHDGAECWGECGENPADNGDRAQEGDEEATCGGAGYGADHATGELGGNDGLESFFDAGFFTAHDLGGEIDAHGDSGGH